MLDGEPMTEIALHYRLHRVPQSVDALQHSAADHDPAQHAGPQQNCDGRRQAVPETRRQRLKQRLVPADQQVVALGQH